MSGMLHASPTSLSLLLSLPLSLSYTDYTDEFHDAKPSLSLSLSLPPSLCLSGTSLLWTA